ncbi:MAG: DEAD/DEAH box helicase [Chloroflexi bacterium]|nr:DEAD/DEAH box helicase [Chloroflexota bacterium]
MSPVAPRTGPLPADTLIATFLDRAEFPLDDFQREAIDVLASGASVMVAAPTGTGKTVVAEFAIHRAHARGRRAFYTTPIKALSNQKFRDLRAAYGPIAVGLMTGDVVENPEGRICVMTTEVVRNMLLQRPHDFADVDCLIFDEIHFLSDPARGSTWEESIICAPRHAQLVCLSATVSNAAQVADWIGEVHRPIKLIIHRQRAVPLENLYFHEGALHPLMDGQGRTTAALRGLGGELRIGPGRTRGRGRRGAAGEPLPTEIVAHLQQADLLPAIYFFFSRRECENGAEQVATRGLATASQVAQIRERIDAHLADLDPTDRQIAQVAVLTRTLVRGVGFHHAGLLPVLKALVEELFQAGLLGVVFATDTLALGINMPARTVVVGALSKFDGESRRPLTPNEYRQLTGRAGRRGIDARGVAVIPYSPWVTVRDAIEIATGDLLPIESAFALRYNTALNLWDRGDRPTARLARLFASSLREFQIDDEARILLAEAQALRHELQHGPRAVLDAPAHRWRRGARGHEAVAARYTRRDLLTDRIAGLDQESLRARERKSARTARTIRAIEAVLARLGYIHQGALTGKAAALREIFDANGIILVEAIVGGTFDEASPADVLEALSWFCYDRDRAFFNRFRMPARVWPLRDRLSRAQDVVLRAESDAALALTPGFALNFTGIAHAWCLGVPFEEMMEGIGIPEGDLMQTFTKTLDLGRQVRAAVLSLDARHPLGDIVIAAEHLMRRGIVAACASVGLPPGVGTDAATE